MRIISGFMQFIMKKVLEGHDVQLSEGNTLGSIGVRGRKITPRLGDDGHIKGLPPDWGETKKLWESNPEARANKQVVFCLNEHTNGVRYKFLWFKDKMRLHNKEYYSIKFSRRNKRALVKLIREGKEYEVLNY